MPYTTQEHQQVAAQMPRDDHGHFIHSVSPTPMQPPLTSSSPPHSAAATALPGIQIEKTSDDNTLVDVHVNNPLKKVVALLEEIKNEKAFSFSIKGSLGLAGIAVVLTTFGIFGGSQVLCSKGVQSHIGTMRVLQAVDGVDNPLLTKIADAYNALMGKEVSPRTTNRVVLIKKDNSVIHLAFSGFSFGSVPEIKQSIVTGEYDSCSQTMTVKDPKSIEAYE